MKPYTLPCKLSLKIKTLSLESLMIPETTKMNVALFLSIQNEAHPATSLYNLGGFYQVTEHTQKKKSPRRFYSFLIINIKG